MILSNRGHCRNGWVNQTMKKINRLYQLRQNIFVRRKNFEKKERKSDVGEWEWEWEMRSENNAGKQEGVSTEY